jgi:CheY-like chemotaxis protein
MAYTEKPGILVVEDSRVLAKVIEQRLTPFFSVTLVYDGDEAIQSLLNGKGFAAVVLDLLLPRKDGIEVLRTIRNQGIQIPVIIATAKPRAMVEADTGGLGVESILSKPLDFGVLTDTLLQVLSKGNISLDEEVENSASGKKYPYRIATKACFICGYEKVKVYLPIASGFDEDWGRGTFPVYTAAAGYEEWDQLRTLVSVCPYCLFASSDPGDFADAPGAAYPYSEESKKILARSISYRKRLVPEALDIDPRFDNAYRDHETVIISLVLAEKCCNGLILAGKPGAYCQAGVYTTLIGALQSSTEKYREALVSFENQLKHKETPRRVLVRTYFFCIVLNMQLNRTSLGRDILKKVEEMYADARYEEISIEEREWLMRINHLWKVGTGTGPKRDIV